MPKVMILDHVLTEVFALEKVLKNAGYSVCLLTGAYGLLAKFDFEKPDILLFNPDMPNMETDSFLQTLMTALTMQNMIIVLICSGDADAIEAYCRQMNLHGYYMIENGFDGIPEYLSHFYDD